MTNSSVSPRPLSRRYSLRSLEVNAPWIRHIYIVTNGQVPAWLDTSNPRVSIIPHHLIFPNRSVLPTFSSLAIEFNLHRIPNLSETFLYFNDDVFLGRPVTPWDLMNLRQQQYLYASWPVPDCAPRCREFPSISRRPLRHAGGWRMRCPMRHRAVSLRPRRLPPPPVAPTTSRARPAGQLRAGLRDESIGRRSEIPAGVANRRVTQPVIT